MHTVILAESRGALERHRVAKASGNELAIAGAHCDLERARAGLLRARNETEVLARIAKALRAPRRIGW